MPFPPPPPAVVVAFNEAVADSRTQADRKLLVGEIERLVRVRADLARQIAKLEGDVKYLEHQLQMAQDRPGNGR